jgi:hypothetical protein
VRANLFLIINAIVVGFLLLRQLFGSKPTQPTPLKEEVTRFRQPVGHDHYQEDREKYQKANPGQPGERSLNCLFQYNSHTWDAFEVLGVPAGSGPEACKRALHDMRRNGEAPNELLENVELALKQYFSA